MGVVVKDIRILEDRIRQRIRIAINNEFQIPSIYILKIHQFNTGSPSPFVKKILIIKVKTRMNTIARNDLKTTFKGILEINTIISVKMSKAAKEARL